MISMYDNFHPLKKLAVLAFSYLWTIDYRLLYRSRVSYGKNFITNWKTKIKGPGKVTLGNNINAWAHEESNLLATFSPDAEISIGDNSKLNGAHIQARDNISIGNNCILASCVIVDTDIHSIHKDRTTNPKAPISSKPITIKNNVWIAGRSAVLKGVTIGENSIVGFGSVVRDDIPPNSIAIGNPAQVVGNVPE